MDIKHWGGLGLDIQDEKAQRAIKERGGTLTRGIGCKNGILITPRGIYNVISLGNSSNKFPQAMIISPISEIFDQEILLGDQVSKYMQNCVVQERYIFDDDGGRKFRREAVLLQKEIGYIVLVDNNGVIHKLEQFKMEDEIKRKKEERTTAEEKAKIAENIEKIFEDAVKDNKFTVHCYEQAIGGTEDIDNIKSMVLTTFANNEMYGPEGGKDTPVSFSWHGYSDDLTKTKEFIVNYNKESGAVFVDWDIRYKEDEVYAKYEDKRVDSDEEINKIVRKAVSDNKIHFMTNWTDEEKNKIANFLLDKEALLKLEFYNIADYGDKVLFGKDVVLEGMDKIRIIVKVNIKIKKAELYFE